MTYTYNPHRHVKIWLSDDPNSFMNFENQLRLVKMRERNKNDEINLVYDSRLLGEKARQDIVAFAKKHNIKLLDVFTDVMPHCIADQEKSLIEKYDQEILQLKVGGNTGRASDILRWLKPVYTHGTYSDLDSNVDTSHLPATIPVDAPILLNLGSGQLNVYFKKFECPVVNNDVVAVVDPDSKPAQESIRKIQEQIIKSYHVDMSSPFKAYSLDYREGLYRGMGFRSTLFLGMQSNQVSSLDTLHNLARYKSLQQLHQYIQQMTVEKLIRLSGKTKEDFVKAAKANYKPSFFSWLFLSKEAYKRLKDTYNMTDQDAFLKVYLSKFKLGLLKDLVVYTTGPGTVLISMFPNIAYSLEDFINKIKPYSMQSYNLHTAFNSQNSFSLNLGFKELQSKLSVEIGELNDLSWLQEGVDARKKRELKMNSSAKKIQRLFKNKHKQMKSENLVNVRQNINKKLTDIQGKLKENVQSIQSDLNGCFGFYNRKKREARVAALNNILSHFSDNNFNAVEFHKNRSQYHLSGRPDGFWKSKTQTVLNDLVLVSMQKNLRRL